MLIRADLEALKYKSIDKINAIPCTAQLHIKAILKRKQKWRIFLL